MSNLSCTNAIELYSRIIDKIRDSDLRLNNLSVLGVAYESVGRFIEGINFLQEGLNIAQDASWKCVFLNNLGNLYGDLCEVETAIEYFEKSQIIARDNGFQKSEAVSIAGLGNSYNDLGQLNKSIEFHERSLAFARKTRNQRGEATDLGNIGLVFADLGDTDKALEFYEQALAIDREIGYREGESVCLGNIGDAKLDADKAVDATVYYLQAIEIADQISFPSTLKYSRWGLAQAYLSQQDLIRANAVVVAAQAYDIPQVNHNISVLHGIISLRQGNLPLAKDAFEQACSQANIIISKTPGYYDAVDAKGLAFCGLALLADKQYIHDAKDAFRAARRITSATGILNRTLRLFDELSKADPEGILAEIRPFAEGKE